jgi:hypothetical protein
MNMLYLGGLIFHEMIGRRPFARRVAICQGVLYASLYGKALIYGQIK